MVKKIGQRKFLLKHGYFESELDKMTPSEAKRIIASIEKIEHPQGQRKVYSEKEINAIKEFVDFIEDRLIILIKDENYQANIAEAENDNLRKNVSLLIAETIEAIKNSMKPTLEKFLEERKNG